MNSTCTTFTSFEGVFFQYHEKFFSFKKPPSKQTSPSIMVDGKQFFLNDLPSQILIFSVNKSIEFEKIWSSNVIKMIKSPLIKTYNGKIKGFVSGCRSGILSVDEKLIRLKGCGNNEDGFVVKEIPPVKNQKAYELRGCMFEQTCYRELMFSNILERAFKKKNLPFGNVPIGFWKYKHDKYDKIGTFCGIFETLGDKRLNDHLIYGLEKLIKVFINVPNKDKLKNHFPDERWYDPKERTDLRNTAGMIFESELFDGERYKLIEFTKITEGFDFVIPKEAPKFIQDLQKWKSCVNNLKKMNKNERKQLFPMLFSRIGREVGLILRTIHDEMISWGTFSDFLGTNHCNSHSNNLIVLPNITNGMILAPVDFDMAFDQKNYIGKKKFKEILQTEVKMMKKDLAGIVGSHFKLENMKDDSVFNVFRWGMRDTMVISFENAYKDSLKFENKTFDVFFNSIIELALLTTKKVIS